LNRGAGAVGPDGVLAVGPLGVFVFAYASAPLARSETATAVANASPNTTLFSLGGYVTDTAATSF